MDINIKILNAMKLDLSKRSFCRFNDDLYDRILAAKKEKEPKEKYKYKSVKTIINGKSN